MHPDRVVDPGSFRLSSLDMGKSIKLKEYETQLKELQTRLVQIQHAFLHTKDSAVVIFEGWDAAGKGGAIRCMSAAMDPRGFKVWPIAAPTALELKHHYLRRFWDRLPPRGGISVFDRSWYGRVLVERIEKLASKTAWRRAYQEITDFEQMLTDEGARIVKLFLHITPEEQLKRFRKRVHNPLKRWKLSYEDFRNRDKWPAYEVAIEEMVQRTASAVAPWHVIPANSKPYARISSLSAIVETLSADVDLSPPKFPKKVRAEIKRILGVDPP